MRKCHASDRQSGFTLIEIMIVIAIIGGMMAIAGPKLFSTAAQKRAEIRRLAVLPREIRNVARLYNNTGRLVINMEKEKAHSYAVESAEGSVTFLSKEREEDLAKLTKSQREDEGEVDKFKPETRVMRKPQTLPKGLFFESVEFGGGKNKEITEGAAYVHFFPQGLSEDVAIHVTDRKTLNWTITINPLTGRADVYERRVSLKELGNK